MTEHVAARALALVGTPFRLGGRDAAHGLDCIGLLLVSHDLPAPPCLPLRATYGATDRALWQRGLSELGLARLDLSSPGADGDVLLLDCGRGRHHVAIHAGRRFVHAHAGLGRVVASRSLVDMALLSRWRRVSAAAPAF